MEPTKKVESLRPSHNVYMEYEIEVIDQEEQDTSVELSGHFYICGASRNEFAEKLGKLIDEYRI
ncbi:hypothetical protein [Algicola sagamiensis]|uniref:hypothetical protein n=1 Tax=Algicola sagamiensis TaxID=163869 RepID=UPI000374A46F|nr:hypothetical protein [Algicola sagamiensis]